MNHNLGEEQEMDTATLILCPVINIKLPKTNASPQNTNLYFRRFHLIIKIIETVIRDSKCVPNVWNDLPEGGVEEKVADLHKFGK